MVDLTRLARALGLVFLGYFLGWPVLAVLDAVFAGGFHVNWFDDAATWWAWPVPCIFPPLSAVLTIDFFRRLHRGQLRPSQVSGYRFVALLLVAGAAFAVSRYWEPLLVSGLCALPMFLPAKKRAAATAGER
jgi:hypothetical protein